MKKLQKLMGVVLVVMLISIQLVPLLNVKAEGLIITTYGENAEGIRSDLVTNTANLIVDGVTNGDILTAYKILDAFYNESTNEVTYDFTSDFQAFLAQSTNETYKNMTVEQYYNLTSDNEDGNASHSVITTSTLNILVSNYTTYLRANNTITGIDMTTTNRISTVTVPAGAYLVLPKSIFTVSGISDSNALEVARNTYGVMIGNVVIRAGSVGWELSDCTIYAKKVINYNRTGLGNFSSSEFFDAMSGIGEIEQFFYQEISSVIGRKHFYLIDLSLRQLPTNAINNTYMLEVQFPQGITYSLDNAHVVIGSDLIKISNNKIVDISGKEIGKITPDSQKITVELNENIISESFINLFFDVELNSNAIVGVEGNEFTSVLTIAADPYVEGSITTLESSSVITTYGLELTSYGEKDDQGAAPLLTGAKYEIYADTDLTKQIGDFTVGDNGTSSFAGVPSGTIYLKQVKAPAGYQLIKDVIPVEIATEDAIAGTQEGYYQVVTYNDAMWYLPTTGGIGTIIYTVVGLIIIAAASFGVIYYRKNQLKINN